MVEHPLGDQGLQTRDRILSTAARLFSEHGYEHTPLSQVAREAQVSKALVLWHFDSKEKPSSAPPWAARSSRTSSTSRSSKGWTRAPRSSA